MVKGKQAAEMNIFWQQIQYTVFFVPLCLQIFGKILMSTCLTIEACCI